MNYNLNEARNFINRIKEIFKASKNREFMNVLYLIKEKLSFMTTSDLYNEEFEYYDEFFSLFKTKELLTSKEILSYKRSKSSKTRGDLFIGVFKEFEDLFLCIVNGYYSNDDRTWLSNLTKFFEAMLIIIDNIIESLHEQDVDFPSLEDAFKFFSWNNYLHRFIIVEGTLELHSDIFSGGLVKIFKGFNLNFKKISIEQALRYEFFQKHLKWNYKKVDRKEILKKLNTDSTEYNGLMNQKDRMYKDLRYQLKQICSRSHREVGSLLKKFEEGALKYDHTKLYFNLLSKNERTFLFQEALIQKNYLILFELLTEKPMFYELLSDNQKKDLTRDALMGKNPIVISILINEGHLANLEIQEVKNIIQNYISHESSDYIIDKLKNWHRWRSDDYLKFRGKYIHIDDVKILREIEQYANIKLIWSYEYYVFANHTFNTDDNRRVIGIHIGSGTEPDRDLIKEKIDKFYFIKNPVRNEFKANKHIIIKLEKNRVNIYVDDELFKICTELCTTPPSNKFPNDIESIDQIEANYKGHYNVNGISLNDEFWGICSNLQVWIEKNYNTRFLHRNIAFPLLKRLTEVGDTNAEKVFQEEIFNRYLSGSALVRNYLKIEGYIKFLTINQLQKIGKIRNRPFLIILIEFLSQYLPRSSKNNLREILGFFKKVLLSKKINLKSVEKYREEKLEIIDKINLLITDDDKYEIFQRVYMIYESFYLCLLHGYYSFDIDSWLGNIINFFDMIFEISDEIPKDIELVFPLEFFQVHIENDKLILLCGYKHREYVGFKFNRKKILEDKAIDKIWFSDHLKKLNIEQNVILYKEIKTIVRHSNNVQNINLKIYCKQCNDSISQKERNVCMVCGEFFCNQCIIKHKQSCRFSFQKKP